MSGHSKWSTIKRKKAVTDAARGRIFTKYIREITIAARVGGGEPDANPRLRTAISGAKSVNMPVANIERAIKKGSGELGGSTYEDVHYEGYGPSGVAILVECATDNRNRTSGDVRHAFSKYGGNLGEAGSVSYLFKLRGVIVIDRSAIAEEKLVELALEAGADDVVSGSETHEVYTPVSAFDSVREALAAKGVPSQSAEITKLASLHVPLEGPEAASVLRLLDSLEELDDVQKVYANFSIPDEVLAKLSR